jgi:hypothetical protein
MTEAEYLDFVHRCMQVQSDVLSEVLYNLNGYNPTIPKYNGDDLRADINRAQIKLIGLAMYMQNFVNELGEKYPND